MGEGFRRKPTIASRTSKQGREAVIVRNGKGHEMNLKQRIAVILMNLAMLTELTISIYLSSGDPENFTALFCKYFFSMLIPTLITAKLVVKRLGSEGDAMLLN